MLNNGEMGAMVFQPYCVKAEPGHTIRFVPTDNRYNAESMNGFIQRVPKSSRANEAMKRYWVTSVKLV